jgi:hypothetical protein
LAVPTGDVYVSSDGAWVPLGGEGVVSHMELVDTSADDSHPQAAITGLVEALATKADTSHTHTGFITVTVSSAAPATAAVGDIWVPS